MICMVCLRFNICSAWFLDIRIYQLVFLFSLLLYILYFVKVHMNDYAWLQYDRIIDLCSQIYISIM